MLLLAVALTFIPGFPEVQIPPELILPIFLPPLLFATAQRSSWAVFRVRWRTLLMLAVALVVVSTAVVAGAAWLMIPGIGIPAAIALGAMVAPPDPVAVDSIASRVHMPRRLINVLQSEGLFNDAAAIVIFQAAVAAAVAGTKIASDVVLQFVLGAAIAVLVGIGMGWLTSLITRLVTSMVARSAVTLVVPFAAYILAEEVHASGVIAVVVTALEIQRHSRPAGCRGEGHPHRVLGRRGTAGHRPGVRAGGAGSTAGHPRRRQRRVSAWSGRAAVVCVLVFAVRFAWLAMMSGLSRARKDVLRPTSAKDVLILTWCGMRGLATLALALALPLTVADGTPFPARSELLVIACAVLLATLVLPGLTLPWLMRVLKASEDGSEERDAARVLARRAQQAAIAALKDNELMKELPAEKVALVKEKMTRLHAELLDGSLKNESAGEKRKRGRELAIAVQTIALDAARQEVVAARNEPGMDPEVADRVLRQLDLRTMIMPE